MQNLDPKAKWLFFFRNLMATLVVCIMFCVYAIPLIINKGGVGISIKIILVVIGFIILNYIIAALNYKFYKFELKEDAYRAERGIIHKRYISIPYERIQNVDIHRSLIARILGLSEIFIQTAGYGAAGARGRGSEGKLPGLNPKNAETMRDELIRRAKGGKESGV